MLKSTYKGYIRASNNYYITTDLWSIVGVVLSVYTRL